MEYKHRKGISWLGDSKVREVSPSQEVNASLKTRKDYQVEGWNSNFYPWETDAKDKELNLKAITSINPDNGL